MITLTIFCIAATLAIGLFLLFGGLFGLWANQMFGDPRLNEVFWVMMVFGVLLVAIVFYFSPQFTLLWRLV